MTDSQTFLTMQSKPFVAQIGLVCAPLLLIGIYRSTAASIVASWEQDPFGHGYLVVPITTFLIWRQRHRVMRAVPQPSVAGLVIVAALGLSWLAGGLLDSLPLQQLSFVLLPSALVWAMFGLQNLKLFAFPLGFLLFALPLGERLIPVLQDLTAAVAVRLLSWTGFPVFLEEHVITTPHGSWLVADACSGINYLTSSIMIGYLYAGMTYRYPYHRIGFLLASIAVPLATNGIRVYATIVLASLGARRIVDGMEHYLFGWFVFALTMLVLFAGFGRWREDVETTSVTPQPPPHRLDGGHLHPIAMMSAALMIVGVVPSLNTWLRGEPEDYGPRNLIRVTRPWAASERNLSEWTPHVGPPHLESVGQFESRGRLVKVHVAQYAANQARTGLSTTTDVLYDAHLRNASFSIRRVALRGRSSEVREARLTSRNVSVVVWSWYVVNGETSSSDYWTKLLVARERLFRRPVTLSSVAIGTEAAHADEARTVLDDFIEHLSI